MEENKIDPFQIIGFVILNGRTILVDEYFA